MPNTRREASTVSVPDREQGRDLHGSAAPLFPGARQTLLLRLRSGAWRCPPPLSAQLDKYRNLEHFQLTSSLWCVQIELHTLCAVRNTMFLMLSNHSHFDDKCLFRLPRNLTCLSAGSSRVLGLVYRRGPLTLVICPYRSSLEHLLSLSTASPLARELSAWGEGVTG